MYACLVPCENHRGGGEHILRAGGGGHRVTKVGWSVRNFVRKKAETRSINRALFRPLFPRVWTFPGAKPRCQAILREERAPGVAMRALKQLNADRMARESARKSETDTNLVRVVQFVAGVPERGPSMHVWAVGH